MSHSISPRMAGAKLLHAVMVAQFLPGYRPSPALQAAVDATVDHILRRHPDSPTGREWFPFREGAE